MKRKSKKKLYKHHHATKVKPPNKIRYCKTHIKIVKRPAMLSVISRGMIPSLIAHDIIGVQPMSGPSGLIFSLKVRYAHLARSTKPKYRRKRGRR